MGKVPRELSESGYYHITFRGAGQAIIFEDDEDYRAFLRILRQYKNAFGFRVIAWCLMSNHVHLLLDFEDKPQNISDAMRMKRDYSVYFNKRHKRTGSLYDGPYWSCPIKNDGQLAATAHYIHMNPQKAGICPMEEYRWSSYQEYLGKHWVVDTSTMVDMFGSVEAFISYAGDDALVARRTRNRRTRLTDEQVLKRALNETGTESAAELRMLEPGRRNPLLRTLRAEGCGLRQLARTFGVSTATIQRVVSKSYLVPK